MWGTAQGILSLLTEKDSSYRVRGITLLESIVDREWPQIAEEMTLITSLATNESFEAHENASKLASKIYYYLGQLDQAVKFAILAGSSFDVTEKDDFTQSVSAQCISHYIGLLHSPNRIPKQLSSIVKFILQNMIDEHRYSACLCLAIETRFTDYVKDSLRSNKALVERAIELSLDTINESSYRIELLRLLVDFSIEEKNYFQISQLYHSLRDPVRIAELLNKLKSSRDHDNWLMAFQIAFELAENADQNFRAIVIENLRSDFVDLRSILTREKLLQFYLDFLFRNNNTDIQIIVRLKETLKTTKMLYHSSVVCAYSFMFAGTGDDNFYRNNTQWFSNGKKWAQFFTIAAVGAIHIGHLSSAQVVLGPFLVKGTPPYALGGGLFAIGLIYANYSWENKVIEIMTQAISTTKSYVVKHGGCLALGLISMGSKNQEHYNIVKSVLFETSPEAGEAAGYALGMIMLGSGYTEDTDAILQYANKCEHEKIVRGCAMGFAFMMYGKRDDAETFIAQLLTSKKPLLRESAAWVIALAYVGTASNTALERLLHLAVSDVNPDVRRASVIGVGFVLSRSPKDVPGMLDLLAKSYHPHVRSGAALAVGIACAGTGMQEAITILEPLLEDLEDFVKQSAMIAMAMVLQQQSDTAVPYAKTFRQYLRKLITKDRNELQTYGLCLAYGILNAGGRNIALSCNTLRGENSILATVGIALFCNYFYWLPLSLMLPLAFHPTAVIGLDKDLQTPKWNIFSGAEKCMFSYPPLFLSEEETAKETKAAKLSITKNSVQHNVTPANEPVLQDDSEGYQILENSSRVTLNQLGHIDFNYSDDYKPITGKVFHGFVMLKKVDNKNP